jgi:HlyD family secretion protein
MVLRKIATGNRAAIHQESVKSGSFPQQKVVPFALKKEELTPDQNQAITTALQQMPLSELGKIVEELKADLEQAVAFVNSQEEELKGQGEIVVELAEKLQKVRHFERPNLEVELANEKEKQAMLEATLIGQRSNIRNRERIYNHHYQVLRARQETVPANPNRQPIKIKFRQRGSRWLIMSALLAAASFAMAGWVLYSKLLNPLSPVEVKLLPVEKATVEDIINESGTVELREQQTLKSPVEGGIIEQVLVKAGQPIAQGQKLILLRNSQAKIALAQQQLEIDKQQFQLERSRQQVREASQRLQLAQQEFQSQAASAAQIRQEKLQLERNREKVLEVTTRLKTTQEELREYQSLLDTGALSGGQVRQKQDQVLQLQSQLSDAKLAVKTATLQLKRLESESKSQQDQLSERLLLARSQLRDAQSTAERNLRELQRLKLEGQKIEQESQRMLIQAPARAKILDIPVKVGDVLKLGDPLLILGDPTEEFVTVELSPLDAARLRLNQTARLRTIGPKPETFKGRVYNVSELASVSDSTEKDDKKKSRQPVQATVTVTVKLDSPSQTLIPGTQVDVEILINQRPNVVALERDIIQGAGADTFVWVRDGQGKAQKRPVKLGLEGLTTVEITSGLRPGDKVLLPTAQAPLKPGIPVMAEGNRQ